MYDKFWYDLGIDCSNAILPNVDIKYLSTCKPEGLYVSEGHGQWCERESQALQEYFCQDWLHEVNKKLNLTIDCFMVFNINAHRPVQDVHMDMFEEPYVGTAVYGLNFCPFGGEDSYMKWFKFKEGTSQEGQKEVNISKAQTLYKYWQASELDEVDSHSIGKSLTIVRADIPHGVETTNSERWAISLRVRNENIRTWDDICNHLSHLIK